MRWEAEVARHPHRPRSRFSSRALRRLLAQTFPGGEIEVEAGNGLAAEELDVAKLAYVDRIYEMV